MAQFLIHVTCGIENPSKSALAFLVAKSALEEGHSVTLFLAAEAVQLLRPEVLEGLKGLGTGSLGEHLAALRAGGARFFASGMSAASRGFKKTDVGDLHVEFAPPSQLVRLATETDKIFCY